MSRLVPHALMVASLTVLAPGCESSGAPLDTGFDESDGSGTETGDDLPPARA